MLTLTPMVRWQREEVLPWHLGAFVQGGVGIAYVKTQLLSQSEVGTFEIDESDYWAEVMLGAGLSRAVTSSTSIELIPSYRFIFADETGQQQRIVQFVG